MSEVVQTGEGRWTPDETFGDRLVLLRRHAGRISQVEAALRCGVNPKTWAQWELGRHPHKMGDLIDRICNAFRDAEGRPVSRQWLLWGGVSPEYPSFGHVEQLSLTDRHETDPVPTLQVAR